MKKPIKIRLVFNRRKQATPRKDRHPVKGTVEIEITDGPRRKWISTGVRVYADQWGDGMVCNHIDAMDMNIRLRRMYEEAARVLQVCVDPMAVADGQVLRKDFCDWMEERIEMREDIAPNTKRAHLRTVESLRATGLFHRFSDLTERNVTLWDEQLKRRLNKQSAVHGVAALRRARVLSNTFEASSFGSFAIFKLLRML